MTEEAKATVSLQERAADGSWKELGRGTVNLPDELPPGLAKLGTAEESKGRLGVVGDGFDRAVLKARMSPLCGEARQHGVARYLLSVRQSVKGDDSACVLPAKLFEDHVDGATKRVDAAKEALAQCFREALDTQREEGRAALATIEGRYASKAKEDAATVASFKATAEKATADMGRSRHQLGLEGALLRDAHRRAEGLAAALKRANAKLRALRMGRGGALVAAKEVKR